MRWKLKGFLEAHKLSVRAVSRESGLSLTGVYKMARNEVKGLEFEALGRVIVALEKLTHKRVEPNDVLEVVRNG